MGQYLAVGMNYKLQVSKKSLEQNKLTLENYIKIYSWIYPINATLL